MVALCFLQFHFVIGQTGRFTRKQCFCIQGTNKNRRHIRPYLIDKVENRFSLSTWKSMQMKHIHRGVLEPKKTLISVAACFVAGLYSVPFSYLLFSIPATFVGAPSYFAGLFSVFISAAVESLYGRQWTGTQILFYLCFVFFVLWDWYENVKFGGTDQSSEPMKVESIDEIQTNKLNIEPDKSETISSFRLWDEKFCKAIQNKDQPETPE